MSRYDLAGALTKSGAMCYSPDPAKHDPAKPHPILTSKLHSDGFVNLAMFQTDPFEFERGCSELARRAVLEYGVRVSPVPHGVEWVIGPATGGISIAQECAKWLGVKSAYAEKMPDGSVSLERFTIPEGSIVLVAEDLITTGGSALKVVEEVRRIGCNPIRIIAAMANRRGVPTIEHDGALYDICSIPMNIKFKDFMPEECPFCKIGSPALHPKKDKNWIKFIT